MEIEEAWERFIVNSLSMGNKYTKLKINTRNTCIAEPRKARAGREQGP